MKHAKGVARGLAQADAAVLVLSAETGEFEASMERTGLSKDCGLLAGIYSVRQLVVAVTKMDAVAFSEQRFSWIVAEVWVMLGVSCSVFVG